MELKPTHCFLVPGAAHPQDLVHPITGHGVYSGDTPERMAERFPGVSVVEIAEYRRRRAAEQDAPITWRRSTREAFWYALEVLPPIGWRNGTDSEWFLVGEPYDHHAVTGEARFEAHWRVGDSYFVSSRPMTLRELRELRG